MRRGWDSRPLQFAREASFFPSFGAAPRESDPSERVRIDIFFFFWLLMLCAESDETIRAAKFSRALLPVRPYWNSWGVLLVLKGWWNYLRKLGWSFGFELFLGINVILLCFFESILKFPVYLIFRVVFIRLFALTHWKRVSKSIACYFYIPHAVSPLPCNLQMLPLKICTWLSDKISHFYRELNSKLSRLYFQKKRIHGFAYSSLSFLSSFWSLQFFPSNILHQKRSSKLSHFPFTIQRFFVDFPNWISFSWILRSNRGL